MSTVAEVIAARHMEIKVLAISCVTNMAAGILDQPLSHAEVMETGERVKTIFEALLRAVLPRIAQDVGELKGCPTLLAHFATAWANAPWLFYRQNNTSHPAYALRLFSARGINSPTGGFTPYVAAKLP